MAPFVRRRPSVQQTARHNDPLASEVNGALGRLTRAAASDFMARTERVS